MRKFVIFPALLLIFTLFAQDGIAAKCIPSTCPKSNFFIGEDKEYVKVSQGGNQCFSCDSNDFNNNDEECKYDSIVGTIDNVGRIVNVYKCIDILGTYDIWRNFDPGTICDDSTVIEVANAYKFYSLSPTTINTYSTGGNYPVATTGSTGCYYFLCKDGYTEVNGKCVSQVNAEKAKNEAECKKRPHMKWEGGKCVCKDAGKNETPDKTKCVGAEDLIEEEKAKCAKKSNAGYVWDSNKKICRCANGKVENSAKTRCDAPPIPQDQKNCQNLKNFGVLFNWKNGQCVCNNGFPLVVENNVGTCPDPNQDQMDKCNAARNPEATWDNVNKVCKCKDPKYEWNGSSCEKTSATIAAEEAEICIAGGGHMVGTICVCNNSNHVWYPDRKICDSSAEYISAEIQSTFNEINTVLSGFDSSVWKNAEGKFNTSRLISDSVAGVVLGTAGGLITSNVIKKNQVKGGFEDISCSVGGQVVAG
ncbi:MAG: hypothetical protein LBD50_00360, partial [Rickettsiales bacterium]|nr:hypothetical protein [Rickettsiales bacterium]